MTVTTGISGLDVVLNGGYAARRTTVVSGGPGSGKTVLASQFVVDGAVEAAEACLMILFEESAEAIQANYPGIWPVAGHATGTVYFVDGRLPDDSMESGTFDLGGLIAIASSLVTRHDIKRIAIDGIDALFAISSDLDARRREFVRLLDWLAQSGVTALLTIKTDLGGDGRPPHYDLVEYAADGVIALRSTMIGELLRRTLRVVKMRGAGFISGGHPYIISDGGIRVLHSPTRTRWAVQPLDLRLATGVERLDAMLLGGYRVGTTTLVSGPPGSAKTTLGAAFLAAGARAGERGLYIGFDEPAEQMMVDAHSVGIDLDSGVSAGLLRIESFTAGAMIGEEHYLAIERLIELHEPVRVVIDPASALDKAGGREIGDTLREQLLVLFKSHDITALVTAIADGRASDFDMAQTRLATLADSWIHVDFSNRDGERNRTLAVLKARGTGHSNQIRELLLSAEGVDLADVYTAPGDVLSGTARVQREQQIAAQREREEERLSGDLATLDRERENLSRALQEAQRSLAQLAAERADLVERDKSSGLVRARDSDEIRFLRRGDSEV
jgi:circadian clock protein KaiC